jgi:hypothetical protein
MRILCSGVIPAAFSHHELDPQSFNEVKQLHQLIKDRGEQGDYGVQMKFGDLIQVK